jgi:PAS domain S-box-containing protein
LRPIAGYHVPPALIPSFLEFPLPIKGALGHEELWRAHRAFWTSDAAADRRLDPEMLRRFPHRSNLVVPMVVKDEPIGALVVIWWHKSRVMTPDELRLVEGVSGQAATFLGNARLYEALEERLVREQETRLELERSERRQAAFAEILKELAGESDLERLVALVGRRASQLLSADAVIVALVEGEDVVVRGHWGVAQISSVTPRRPIAESRVVRVIRDRRSYATPDMTADPVWRDAELVRAGYRAIVEAPIILRSEVIGVMGALQRTPRAYSDEDVRLLTALAEHAALAVDRAHARAQRESRLRETERLLAVSQATASTLDVTEVARRTLRELVHALDADVGGAWMVAPDGPTFIPLAGYHVPPGLLDTLDSVTLDPEHPLIAEARRMERPLAFPDSANDPLLEHPMLRRLSHRSLLVCPMRLGEDVVGGFGVAWLDRAHVFTPEELRLVEGMARTAAVAIENARLIAAERRAGDQLAASEARYRALVENVDDIVYVHDLGGVIQEINEAGVRLSGYRREQLIGMNVSKFLAPEDFARASRVFGRMAAGEITAGLFTAEFLQRDGGRRLLECSSRVIHRDGVVVGVQGVARDITDRRRLEQRQAVLVALSRELASEVDLDAILGRVAERVRSLMGTDGSVLLLREGEDLVIRGGAGLEPELWALGRLGLADSLTGAVARERRPVVCADLTTDPDWGRLPIVTRLGYRAMVAVPLAVQDRILGVLKVLHHAPRGFTREDVEFLEALATQAALAIDNARLLAQTQARLRDTETLVALGETVIPALDLTERMRLLARGASRAFGADTVGAYLADSKSTSLVPMAGYHVPRHLSEDFLTYPIPLGGHPVLEEAWQSRVPVSTLDMREDPRVLPEIRDRFPARSVVFAPIVVRDRPIGGLFLVWWERERGLNPDEMKLLGAICRHAALFVENARLYEEATGREHEAEELARQARSLTENLDATEVGRRTVESARQMLGGIAATLRRVDGAGRLTLVASSGDQHWIIARPLRLDPPEGVIARAAFTRMPAWSTDIRDDADFSETYRRQLPERGSLSLLAVPLQAKGELIGVLSVGDRVGRVFQAFADQAAIALENSRLYGDLREALHRVEETQRRGVQGERLRALGELAGGVAHDFNNVLAIVVGRAEVLMAESADPTAHQHLEVIMKVALDAAQTVRRIQEFTRKRLARPFQAVSLNELVDEVVEVTRSRWKDAAQARGVRYDMVVERGVLPEVAGEPSELREALTNIVFNALDAMPNGGTVSLRTGVEGDTVVCAIRDSGVGMPEAVRQRVFDPFFTTKGERGTGLGLSVVYGIVTRHGGDIDVQSRLGAGTTFTLHLPIRRPAPEEPPAALTTVSRSARVLVVDDEKEVRDILTSVLSGDGHVVVACEDGDGAIACLDGDTFDLVITDLGMPGLSGWDVARAVKELRPGTPVAMVTGWSEQIDPAQAGSEGVDYLIAKPFRRHDIRVMLAAALGGRR